MKQLIIFNPSIEDGGVEKNLFLITNYLSTKGIKIKIICSDNRAKNKFNKKIELIYPKKKIDSSGRYKKYFFCLILLIKEIIKSRNTSVLSFQANIYAMIVCLFFNIKIIARMNTSPSGWSHNIIKNYIFNFFIKYANYVIVNSSEFKKEVDRRYNIKSICIYNPFDFKKIKLMSNVKIKNIFKKNKLKLINIGRLTDQKNQILILKAINLLKKDLNLQLIILGKGKNYNKLKDYLYENKLNNIVNLLGYKKNPYPYIKQSDVFILSSNYEGSPNVLIEAMYLKVPVISTNCPTGPKEILKNGKLGTLINTNNRNDLIQALYKFNKKKRVVNSAYKSVKDYNWSKNCKKYYEMVKKIIY